MYLKKQLGFQKNTTIKSLEEVLKENNLVEKNGKFPLPLNDKSGGRIWEPPKKG